VKTTEDRDAADISREKPTKSYKAQQLSRIDTKQQPADKQKHTHRHTNRASFVGFMKRKPEYKKKLFCIFNIMVDSNRS